MNTTPSTRNPLIYMIAGVLIAALAAGGGVYAYQKQQSDTKTADLQAQIDTLTTQLNLAKASPVATVTPVGTTPVSTATPKTTATPVATATPASTATPATAATYSSTTPIDVLKIKVGDAVGKMKVTSIQPFKSSYGPLSSQNAKITFSGSVEVAATFTNQGGITNGVCASSLDNVSASWLPKLKAYDEGTMFCLTNDLASSEFSPSESRWNADVTINNYTLNAYPSEVTNSADLVTVVSKNKY